MENDVLRELGPRGKSSYPDRNNAYKEGFWRFMIDPPALIPRLCLSLLDSQMTTTWDSFGISTPTLSEH